VDGKGDPGYRVMTDREIAEEVMARDKADSEGDDDEADGPPVCKIKLSE
jgi:hypothetical protein